jgi:competence protein ComEC
MPVPDDSRSAVDQSAGRSAPSSVQGNGDNVNGQIAVLAPRTVAMGGQPRAGQPKTVARQPLLFVAAAMATGIVVDRYWPIPLSIWLTIAISSLAICAWFCVRTTRFKGVPPNAIVPPGAGARFTAVAALLVAVAAAGGMWHHMRWRLFAANDIGRYAREQPQPVSLEVIALTGPRVRPALPPDPLRSIQLPPTSVLRVEATALRDGNLWRDIEGRATMTVEGTLLGVHAGDRLRIVGQLQAPTPPSNPGEFDFAEHRRGDRELAAIRADHPDCVQILEQAPWYSPRRMLGKLRASGDRLLWGTLSHERAGLASAVLLGAREQLDDEIKDDFLVTGTVHILSISGLHVGILAYVLFKGFRTGWIPRGPALVAVALITLAYTLVADAEPPAVRATVLVWVVCGAIYLGRPALGVNAVALAAIIVLALNPADLFRTGTQLSFLAVATLVAFGAWRQDAENADALTQLIRATRPWPIRTARWVGRWAGSLALAGLMIWLVTSPLVAHRFHVVSLSGLVLNVALWIPVFLAMALGFAVLTIGWLVPPVGWLLGLLCDLNLRLIEWSIDWAAQIPGSYFWTAGPSEGWLYAYYALLVAPFFAPRILSGRRSLLLASAWVVFGVAYSALSHLKPAEREMVCGFVAVGHGSAVVIELPDGQVWLYDAGRLGSPRAGARSIEAYLRSQRISRIDALILSHADIDHYNAVPELLEKFSVETIYVSPQMFREDTAPLQVLREAIEEAGVPVKPLVAGDALVVGDFRASVLHPPPDGVEGNDNAQSIVLSLEYNGCRVLLTGDLEGEGVRQLLAGPPLDCDILMAPHHGSPQSDPAAVVSWSTPEWVVISNGYAAAVNGNAYDSLLGPRALSTAEVGAVRARLSGERVEVRAWRIDPW